MSIIRIVRMEFEPDKVEAFLRIFNASKDKIRNVAGCEHLELRRDPHHPHVRYTYSVWDSQKSLDAYRKSKLFGSVWPETKKLFSAKPVAYSLAPVVTPNP